MLPFSNQTPNHYPTTHHTTTLPPTLSHSNNATLDPNSTSIPYSMKYEPWTVAIILTICGTIVAGTILGNILVCIAVAIVRKLRTPSNLLIVSLAVSDLLVAILDMPFAAVYEVMDNWVLGQVACDTWTSLDVLLCTASILNLCMISIDRYFVITKPLQYAIKRTPARMALMIGKILFVFHRYHISLMTRINQIQNNNFSL